MPADQRGLAFRVETDGSAEGDSRVGVELGGGEAHHRQSRQAAFEGGADAQMRVVLAESGQHAGRSAQAFGRALILLILLPSISSCLMYQADRYIRLNEENE